MRFVQYGNDRLIVYFYVNYFTKNRIVELDVPEADGKHVLFDDCVIALHIIKGF